MKTESQAARRSRIYRIRTLGGLRREVEGCTACPRLREYCSEVARKKRAAYREQEYWGAPVPSFGDENARILLMGLAPGAHGSNRTGRMFTGDASGHFLYAALHRAGLASQAESIDRNDGMRLRDVYISAVGRCAPPGNKPLPQELTRCLPFQAREFSLLPRLKVVVCLGKIAFDWTWKTLEEHGVVLGAPRPRFAHNAVYTLGGAFPTVLASYHPSQQNTQTGRFTASMIDEVLARAKELAAL